MYAQAAIKPSPLLRNGAYGIVMRGVQKCTCAGASLRDRYFIPLCCIIYRTATDPACGTAGFLISAYNYIKKHNVDEHGNSTLTADDMNRINANFAGYDISPDMVRLSRVNMYLHRFSNPNISEYDTLTSLDKWEDKYDVIFANPPFMTPKGGIVPHARYRVSAKRSEVLFVDYIAEHLLENGRAAVIVPEGIVFQSQTAYKQMRKMLIEEYLYAVISLPAGVFNPYSGVKTSILIMDMSRAKEKDSILFVKLNNDGFDLGAQRREIKGSEIPDVLNIFRDYKAGKEVSDRQNVVVAKKEDIKNQDYILVGERYRKEERIFTKWPTVSLGEICNFINGLAFKPSDWSDKDKGGLPIIRIQNLNNPDAGFNYFLGKVDSKYLVNNGDLLFSWSGSKGTSFGAHIWNGDLAILNQHIFRVEYSDNILKEYLFYALNKAVMVVEQKLHGGVGLVHITKGDLEDITIPLPPLTVQQEIVDEIESYQRIIDGARQVVDNYKPTIKVEPEWELKSLDSLCALITKGTTPTTMGFEYTEEGINFVKIESITPSGKIDCTKMAHISEKCHEALKRSQLECDDILFSIAGSMGATALVGNDTLPANTNQALCIIRLKDKRYAEYISLFLRSATIGNEIERIKVGVAQYNLSLKQVGEFEIPMPDYEVCECETKRLKEEISIVEQNKRLIEIFQQKIDDKIAEVWRE